MNKKNDQKTPKSPATKSILIKALLICLSLSFFVIPNHVQAAYYVDNSASGCSNGKTSYNPANRTCTNGNDTVFTSWDNAVSGVPDGSQSQRTVINIRSGSAYNMSGIVRISKAWTTWQKYPSDASKPVFNWNWSWSSNWGWGAMVDIRANGVTIDGLEIKNAGYGGSSCSIAAAIKIGDGNYGGAGYSDVTVQNCYIHHIGNSGVEFFNSKNITIKNNEFYECQYAQLENGGSCWFASISSSFDTDNVLVSGNVIHESGGEGMNFNRHATNYTIENNVLYDIARPALFLNGMRHATVKNNLVYHTGASRYSGYSAGIMVAAESYGVSYHAYDDAEDIEVSGNMVAGTVRPLGVAEVTTQYGYQVKNIRFLNNKAIEPFSGSSALSIQSDAVGSGVVVKNNIFWQSKSSAAIASIPSGVAFEENLWSKKPPTSAQSASDPRYNTYPAMSMSDYFRKSSGWDNLAPGSLKMSDFDLLPSATYAYFMEVGGSNLILDAPVLSVK
jgi:hypothetical protein